MSLELRIPPPEVPAASRLRLGPGYLSLLLLGVNPSFVEALSFAWLAVSELPESLALVPLVGVLAMKVVLRESGVP